MADLESTVRESLARRLQMSGVAPWPEQDDAHVAEVLAAAGRDGAPVDPQKVDAARQMSRSETDAWLGRLATLEKLATEMLAAFRHGPNGWSARVKADQVEAWKERLGEQE